MNSRFVAAICFVFLPAVAQADPASPELRQGYLACIQHRNGYGGWLEGWEDCKEIVKTLWPQTDEGKAEAKQKQDVLDAAAAEKAAEGDHQKLIHDLAAGKTK